MHTKPFRGILFALPFALAAWLLVCKLAWWAMQLAGR